jgi:predicted RNA-binding protein with TRAM domain
MEDEFGTGGERRERGRGMNIKSSYFLPKPVKIGDEVEISIDSVAEKGDGIGRKDGFVIFVKGGKQGDKLKIRITDVKTRFAVGEPLQ